MDKKVPIVHIINSVINYLEKFGVEDHHSGEVVAFVGEHTERRGPTTILMQSGKLTTPWKEKMIQKDDTETWEYNEYPENRYF